MTHERLRQISEVRANLTNVMEGALSGTPQVIKKRTDEEVVVIAREDYKRLKPTLRDYLLRSAGLDGDQVLDEGIRQAKSTGTLGVTVRAPVEEK